MSNRLLAGSSSSLRLSGLHCAGMGTRPFRTTGVCMQARQKQQQQHCTVYLLH